MTSSIGQTYRKDAMPSLIEFGPVILEKETWNVYDNNKQEKDFDHTSLHSM